MSRTPTTNLSNRPVAHHQSAFVWSMVGLATLSQVGVCLGALSIGPLAPYFKDELGLSRAQVGTVASLLYLGALVSSLPAGALVDAIGVRWMLAAQLGTVALGCFLLSFMSSYSWALAFGLVLGLGYGVMNPATTRAVMDWVPSRARATAMGVKQMGTSAGGAFAAAIAPWLALAFGWRIAFVVLASLVLLTAMTCLVAYRDAPPASTFQQGNTSSISVWRDARLWLMALICALLASIQIAGMTYIPLYLTETLQWQPEPAGVVLSIALVFGSVGRVGWGIVSDRFFGGRRRELFVCLALAVAAESIGLGLVTPAVPAVIVVTLIAAFGLTALGWHGVFMVLVGEVSGRQASGRAAGMVVGLSFLGHVLGTPLFGLLADATTSYRASWLAGGGVTALAALLIARLRTK